MLLVEDEQLILELVRDALDEAGFTTQSVSAGEAAIAFLENNRGRELAGLVTDIDFGGEVMGWDVAQRARELNPAIPVIYVSGGSPHDWSARGVPHSVMITKPFAPVQVVVALANLANKNDAES